MANNKIALPIDPRLDEIIGLLDDHQVVIVQAETGAGKTTRIPQAALAAGYRVTMTQTRRAAVRWNGRRIADELGCTPGELVGWRLRGETPVMSRDTRITLRMDQSVLNSIRAEGRLPEGLLIIDEAHERSVPIDLLLGLVKQYLPNSPRTKVLVTSATIDTEKFSRYFDDAPVMTVPGRVFPVSTEVVQMYKYEHHTQAASRAALGVLDRFLAGTLVTPTADGTGTQPVHSGTIIVLLPGKEDITNVMADLGRAAERAGVSDRVQVMPCHRESTPAEQDAIQAPVPDGMLRFVCGTEVLRNSVTVRQAVGVIDSMQVKRLIVTSRGVSALTKVSVSRAEADQAKGRAGRTAPGFYVAVSFGREYETLAPYPQPAILREPITHVVLQVAAAELDARTFPFLDRPTEDHINVAIRRLQQVGGLDEGEKITETGRLLLQFSIDPERAKALITAKELGVLRETVIVLSVMDAEGIFHRPQPSAKMVVEKEVAQKYLPEGPDLPPWAKRRGDKFELDCAHPDFPESDGARSVVRHIRQGWAGGSNSDFAAVVRGYRAFKAEERRLQKLAESRRKQGAKPGPSRETLLREWCFGHGINFKRLRMAEQVMRDLREELANSPLGAVYGSADEREFDPTALTKALLTGMPDNVAQRTDSARYIRFAGAMGEFRLGFGTQPWDAHMILIDHVRQIPDSRVSVADLAAPVEVSWIIELMPQLVTQTRSNYLTYDPYQDQVTQMLRTKFGALTFEETVAAPDTPAAAKRFAEWLASAGAVPQASTEVQAVVEANAEIIGRWHLLHRRLCIAGRSFADDYEVLLDGVCRQADIRDAELLRFDPPDVAWEAEVLTNRPEYIEILGRNRWVSYGHEYGREGASHPTINWSDLQDVWQLPDEGIRLPDGAEVHLVVSRHTVDLGPWDFRGPVAEFKTKLAEHGHGQRFQDWKRPELPLPRSGDLTAEIPLVVTAEYGRDPMTGNPLLAYGAVKMVVWSGRPEFESVWTRDQAEAEAITVASELAMVPFHEEAERRQRAVRLQESRASARAIAYEAGRLRDELSAIDRVGELFQVLDTASAGPQSDDPDEVLAWVAATEQSLAGWRRQVEQLEERRAALFSRAQALADQGDQLIERHGSKLSEATLAALDELVVPDDQLPRSIAELGAWAARMRTVMARADEERKVPQALARTPVGSDAIAALADALNTPK